MTHEHVQSILQSHSAVRDIKETEDGFSFRINTSSAELRRSIDTLWVLTLKRGDSQTVSELSLEHHLTIFSHITP